MEVSFLAGLHKIPKSEWKELDELMTAVEREIFDVLNSRIDIQKHTLHQARVRFAAVTVHQGDDWGWCFRR